MKLDRLAYQNNTSRCLVCTNLLPTSLDIVRTLCLRSGLMRPTSTRHSEPMGVHSRTAQSRLLGDQSLKSQASRHKAVTKNAEKAVIFFITRPERAHPSESPNPQSAQPPLRQKSTRQETEPQASVPTPIPRVSHGIAKARQSPLIHRFVRDHTKSLSKQKQEEKGKTMKE